MGACNVQPPLHHIFVVQPNQLPVSGHVIIGSLCSLVPRSEEEEKGPGFSHFHMGLIAVEFHHLCILLIYFHRLQTHNYVDTKRYIVCRFIMPACGMQETHCTHPAAD